MSGSINKDTSILQLLHSLIIFCIIYLFLSFNFTISKPPSVVISNLFSGTKHTLSGLASKAIFNISSVGAISKFKGNSIDFFKFLISLSDICLLSSLR